MSATRSSPVVGLGAARSRLSRLRRRRRPRPVVVVSGLPRSGTSMMMRMLAAGGIEPVTDGEREADVDNPGGYYELEQVKGLSSGDADWLSGTEGRAVKVIAMLLYDLPADHTYDVVFMRRRMPEILASQRQMLINRGEDPDLIPDDEMARLYQSHLDKLQRWIDDNDHVRVHEVDYNALMGGDLDGQLAGVVAFLDRPLDVTAMRAVADPDLYRRRA